jgi:hypothetical protein
MTDRDPLERLIGIVGMREHVRPNHLPEKKSRSGLQSACDELIDKGAIITGE